MVEILESPHPQFSEAVARVLGRAPRWTPGRQDGALVRVEYTLPVDFNSLGTAVPERRRRPEPGFIPFVLTQPPACRLPAKGAR